MKNWRMLGETPRLQSTLYMLIPFFFLIAQLLGFFWDPVDPTRSFTHVFHHGCLELVPISNYRAEYQSLLCAAPLSDERSLIQSSGLIHWFVVYGFQIYLVDASGRWLFSKQNSRNLFCVLVIPIILMVTAFHPSSVRAAIALFLRQFSFQKKYFWSALQVAIFSGFLTLAICPSWIQSHSLLISWVAAMTFGFLQKFKIWIRMIAVSVAILPLLSGMQLAHPLPQFIFSLVSRPALFVLFPLCVLGCFEIHALKIGYFIFDQIFWIAHGVTSLFWPLDRGMQFSIFELWAYLLFMMILFLFFENKKLRGS